MQIVAFPFALEIYASREDYEKTYAGNPESSNFPTLLTDKRIFPLNFMLRHDPDVPEEKRNRNLPVDVVMICGPVLAVREAPKSDEVQGNSFYVATIATQFGHLDVAYTTEMALGVPCEKGTYMAFSGMLSADVAVEGLENWME